MNRALSALTAALPLAGLLSAGLPAHAAPLDDPLLGFDVQTAPPMSQASQVRATLSDGKIVGHNGKWIRRYLADGTALNSIGSFPVAGEAGFIVVDPTETFVVVGQVDAGVIYRMNLDASGQTLLGNIPGAFDAAWESSGQLLVSGNTLTRLDVNTGAKQLLADLSGPAGPVEVAADGSVLIASRSDVTPAPAGSSDLFRFDQATLVNPPVAGYSEEDGLIVIEVESQPAYDLWRLEDAKPGFAGEGYFRWDGPNYFNTPGIAPISYPFEVTSGGRYDFVIHNRHDFPEPDKENDVWVRVDNGPWLKCFSNGGYQNVGVWNWLSWFDYSGSQPNEQAFFDLAPGQHTLTISARSFNFHIDRFHFYKQELPNPWSISFPETIQPGLTEADATPILGGLTDPRDLLLNGSDLLIADYDTTAGAGRVQLSPNFTTPLPLVVADPGKIVDELEFEIGPGPATFQAFQPADGGELRYLALDAAGNPDRQILTPKRMGLELSGPGTAGLGAVDITVTDGVPGASALIVYCPAGLASSTELPVPGFPQLLTGLDLNSLQLATLLVPFNSSTELTVTLDNPSGLTGIIELQALLFSPIVGEFVATSESVTL